MKGVMKVGYAYSLGYFPGEWQGYPINVPFLELLMQDGDGIVIIIVLLLISLGQRGNQTCCGGSIPPFQGNRLDRRDGQVGHVSSPLSYYTLHTPYVLNIIQNFVANNMLFF